MLDLGFSARLTSQLHSGRLPVAFRSTLPREGNAMRYIGIFIAALFLATAGSVAAADINFSTGLTQSQFKDLSKEAGIALSYHNVAPSVTLGITGFEIALEATTVNIPQKEAYWESAFNSDPPDLLVIPRLRARKGLPFGLDLGALYSYMPGSNVKLFGVEVSKALIDGGMLTPTLGIRGSYTKLSGVDDLDLQTYAADLNLSKGFALITPYIGAGIVAIVSNPNGQIIGGLKEETITEPRYFGGLKLSLLPLISFTGEVEYAIRPAFSLKAAIGF